jgi:hypothetical protein
MKLQQGGQRPEDLIKIMVSDGFRFVILLLLVPQLPLSHCPNLACILVACTLQDCSP